MGSWICEECNWANPDTVTECRSCGTPHQVDRSTPPEWAARPAWGTPSGTGDAATRPSGMSGVLGGLALGTGAAIIAAIAWYLVVALSQTQIAFVAVLIGWLVGNAVVWGARGRVSVPLLVASPLLTLLALAVSEYLIIYHLVTQELGLVADLLQPLDVMIEIVIESVTADPVTLLFWAIALAYAAWIPFRAMREQVPPGATYSGARDEA
jgi:hypothetical protein